MKTLKDMPPRADAKAVEDAEQRAWYPLVLIFAIVAVGIFVGGTLSYRNYERHFRTRIEEELSAITELKVRQIVQWRRERLADATLLRHTPYVARRALDVLARPASLDTRQIFTAWLEPMFAVGCYEQALLLDERLNVGLVYPEGTSGVLGDVALRAAQQALLSRQIVIADLHRETADGPVYLSLMVPLVVRRESPGDRVPAAGTGSSPADRGAGLLVLQINVQKEFYPLILPWPTPSRTAETLLVRRDGNDALVLNELRCQTNAALKLRIPLERTNRASVKAALGQQGIVDASDYRGVPVVAALRAVPGSPWSLVARMDLAEVYAPLRERLWMTILLMGALLLGAGASVGLLWRQQHVGFYREKAAASEALRASEEKYRGIFDESIATVYIFDNQKNFINANPAGLDLLGYSREELLHMSIPDVDADPVVVLPAHQKLLSGARLINYEHNLRRKDGAVITVLNNSRPLTDLQGNVIGMLSTLIDITERKLAEKALRRSATELRAILESTADGILAVDNHGKVVRANRRFTELWRIPPALLETGNDQLLLDFVLDQLCEPDAFLKKVQSLYHSDAMDMDTLAFKDGRVFERCSEPMVLEGAIIGRVWSFRDITERKRMEEELRASEHRYRELIDNQGEGVGIVDAQERFTFSNPAGDQIFGLLPGSLVGRTLKEFTAPDQYNGVLEQTKRRHTGTRSTYDLEIIRADGQRRWLQVTAAPRSDSAGEFVGTLGIFRDITESKNAEREVRESEEKFAAAFHASPNLMTITRITDGTILEVNEGCSRVLGYSRGESVGKTTAELSIWVDPADRATFFARLKESGQITDFETRLRCKDGRVITAINSARIIKLQDETCAISVVHDITERKRGELRIAAFSQLGQKLSAAKTAREAAEILVEVADQLLGWDACALCLYSPEKDRLYHVLNRDIINGQRVDCPGAYHNDPPSPRLRRTIEGGGQLILREGSPALWPDAKPFGDTTRPSASIMFVPIRDGSKVIGVFSIHSYTPKAYDQQSLNTLQALADHCAGALKRISAQEALSASEANHRALVESSPDAIFLHREGKFLYANPATLKLLRAQQPQQVLGRSVFDIVPPENHDRIRQRIEHAAEGGMTPPLEQKILRLDGTSLDVEVIGIPLTYEGKPAVQTIMRDITERKNSDRRIAAFSNLGQQLSAAKTAREAAEIIVEVADQLLGWDACNFALYSPTKKLILHVLNRDTADGRRIESSPAYNHSPPSPLTNRAIMEGGQLILKEDPARMQPGGLPFGDKSRPSASLLFVPIRNRTDVIGVMSIQSYTPKAYDQHSLDTLQALADHCGGALDRITTEETLRTAQEQLRQSQKMEAVGQLAAGVAHDFNNILAVIHGNAELLLMDPDQLTAEASAGLNQVISAAERAADLTRQLLAFSRKQLLQSQPLLLSDVIANLTKMLNRVIREDIRLQCSYAPRLPFIQADPGMMEQVLLNLVVNARDAMPRGGQLLITTDTASFDAAYALNHPEASAGEFVCLTVSDTGTGIAPEHLPRIFEPFFTTKELGQGTGLGLATVYGIVKQHGGWIEVSSPPGAGATFKVLLPAIAPPAQTAAPPQIEADLRGGTETILLVEDDSSVRTITRRVLESHGYKVCEAASAPEALELWRSRAQEIALLLSDIVMPGGVTGRDFAEQLRASRPTLKVILMSGYSADVIGKDADYLHRTKTGFLQKPFSARTLLESVRRCLDAK